MKDIHPEFADQVLMVAVDVGHESQLTELRAFAETQDYPWPVGQTDVQTLKAFGVIVQSTKIAIDATGTIIYRSGFGQGTNKEWSEVFRTMLN